MRIAGVYDDHCHSSDRATDPAHYEKRFIGHIFPVTLRMERLRAYGGYGPGLGARRRTSQGITQVTTLLIGEPTRSATMSYSAHQPPASRKEWTYPIPRHGQVWHLAPKPIAGRRPIHQAVMIDISDDHYALDISRARTLLSWSRATHCGNIAENTHRAEI